MATKPVTKTKAQAPTKAAAAKVAGSKRAATKTATPAPVPKTAASKGSASKTTALKAAAPAKIEVVTLKAVFEQLGVSHEMGKKQAHEMAAGFVDALTAHLVKGAKLRLSGLGILEVKNRPARMGRNPATGAAVKIAASKKIAFRAAKELKQAV
jgi:DNA-binding protein HU-beta